MPRSRLPPRWLGLKKCACDCPTLHELVCCADTGDSKWSGQYWAESLLVSAGCQPAGRGARRRVHCFSSAGQFVNKVMVVVLERSPVSTAKRWPSALTSYSGDVRSGGLGKSS